MRECHSCHIEHPNNYNWIEVENPRVTLRNNGEGYTFYADGMYYFCSISCLNTYLLCVVSDNYE